MGRKRSIDIRAYLPMKTYFKTVGALTVRGSKGNFFWKIIKSRSSIEL
jgi:hypothetical protein